MLFTGEIGLLCISRVKEYFVFEDIQMLSSLLWGRLTAVFWVEFEQAGAGGSPLLTMLNQPPYGNLGLFHLIGS